MNKKANLIFIITIILSIFLININIVKATNLHVESLKEYYTFDVGNISNFTNSQNATHYLIPSSIVGVSSRTGVIGNALNWSSTSTSQYTSVIANTSGSYTINFWINRNVSVNGDGSSMLTLSNGTSTTVFYLNNPATTFNIDEKGSILFSTIAMPTNNQWNMITLTYSSTLNKHYLFINGVYVANSSNKTTQNKNSLILGYLKNSGIDEVSFWGSYFENYQVTELYNSGVGITYTDITTPTIYIPKCIDENSYCTQPVTIYNVTSCTYSNTTYCSGGCNIDTDVCTQTVNSTCNIISSRKCVSSNQYGVCSDSDGNGGLDYGQVETCALGQICFDSFNFATCQNVSSVGTHTPYNIYLFPSLVDNNNSLNSAYYFDNRVQRVVGVISNSTIHNQDFYNSGSNYITRICDYKETEVYNQVLDISTNNYTVTPNNPTSDNTIIRFSIIPDSISNGTIIINAQSFATNVIYKYYRNASSKQVTIYDGSNNILYIDTDLKNSDSLTSIDFEITFDFVTSYYATKINFNRDNDNIIIISPIAFVGSDIYTTEFTNTQNNVTIKNISYVTIPEFKTWVINVNNTLFVQPCIYLKNGLYKVRTYANNFVNPEYLSYSDYSIDLKFDYTGTSKDTSKIRNNNLSNDEKLIIIFIVVLACIIGVTLIGYMANHATVGFIVGVIMSVFSLIIFTSFGWLKGYVLAILIICSIATIVLVSFLSRNSGGN